MKRWVEPTLVDVPPEMQAAVGGHPLVAQQLVRRGITEVGAALRFLDPARYEPTPPDALPDMDKAVERVRRALNRGERLLVWGDFDVDGQTSTALLVSALEQMGGHPLYRIPNRFNEGHGIHIPTLKRYLDDGVEVVLTCDTGIAAHEALDYARLRGVDVVVTDHHALPDTLPEALALVNPMRLPESHPLYHLSGVGVAYKLAEALLGKEASEGLLDLVALGLVADVMEQVDDTRYLIQRGLAVLRQAERRGIRAMLDRAQINPADVNEETLGFDLAPRLNALGRLEDANPAVELLTSNDASVVDALTTRLEGLNIKRKELTSQIYAGARAAIEREPALLEFAALVIAYPGWHTGVLGIVASRLAEQYNRPVVLLTEEDGIVHGSARSVAGCDITAAIKSQAELLRRFGGHTMAAGLSLDEKNLIPFRYGLSKVVREMLKVSSVEPELPVDAFFELPELSLELAADLGRLAPFGNGNRPLTLATREVHIRKKAQLGRRPEHLELTIEDSTGNSQRVVWWNGADEPAPPEWFDLAYTVRVSTYKGRRELMVEWLDARPTPAYALEVKDQAAGLVVQDEHGAIDPVARLKSLLSEHPEALVWREGGAKVEGVGRHQLRAAETLIVWSAPAGSDEWTAALEVTSPLRLISMGVEVETDGLEAFLRRLGGLVKFSVQAKQGSAGLAELSAAMAQREQTVRCGLEWLAADGQIQILATTDGVYQLALGGTADYEAKQRAQDKLKRLLEETRAYRAFWLSKQRWP